MHWWSKFASEAIPVATTVFSKLLPLLQLLFKHVSAVYVAISSSLWQGWKASHRIANAECTRSIYCVFIHLLSSSSLKATNLSVCTFIIIPINSSRVMTSHDCVVLIWAANNILQSHQYTVMVFWLEKRRISAVKDWVHWHSCNKERFLLKYLVLLWLIRSNLNVMRVGQM